MSDRIRNYQSEINYQIFTNLFRNMGAKKILLGLATNLASQAVFCEHEEDADKLCLLSDSCINLAETIVE